MQSKLLALFVKPSNLIVIAILLGGLLRLMGLRRSSQVVLGTALVALVTFGLLPIGNWLILPLESQFEREMPASADGIIILSGAVNPAISESHGTLDFTDAAERYHAAGFLAQRYPGARVVVTGGDNAPRVGGHDGRPAVLQFLEQFGLDGSRLEFESRSHTTYENGLFTKEMIDPQPGETWILVTSAHHMPRAMGVFRALGWKVVPYPVDYRSTRDYTLGLHVYVSVGSRLAKLDVAVNEWIALIVYRLLGRIQ
jgi:uncharacterized SAM-binding protein YcdF (DUF218 family)